MDSHPDPLNYLPKQKQQNNQLKKRAEQFQSLISEAHSTPDKIKSAEEQTEHLQRSLQTSLKSSETWIFLIINSLQSSIEQRDDPSLCNVPFATSKNNTLTSLNTLSVQSGINLSMSHKQAYTKCKDLIILQENPEKYKEVSLTIKKIIKNYDDQFIEQGLDHFALCVTQYLKRRCMDTDAGKEALGQELKKKVLQETSLESSTGIASNKVLAQACSQVSKPNGQFYLRHENRKNFLLTLETFNNPLISPNEAILLDFLGVQTCGQILEKKIDLFLAFKEKTFKRFLKAALGIGETSHIGQNRSKNSFSARLVFEPNNIEELLENKLKDLCQTLDDELRKKNVKGKGIELVIRNHQYEIRRKREEVKGFYSNGKELFQLAVILLRMFYPVEPIRSLSLKLWNLKQVVEKTSAVVGKVKKLSKNTEEFKDMFVNSSMLPCTKLNYSSNKEPITLSTNHSKHYEINLESPQSAFHSTTKI